MRSWIEHLEEENMNFRRAQDLLLTRINKLDIDTEEIKDGLISKQCVDDFLKDVKRIVEKPL
jgi:hypothetical protein